MEDLGLRHILIPARSGSRGLRNKNHLLVPITMRQVDGCDKNEIILSTNDTFLLEQYKNTGIRIHPRSEKAASVTASMRDVVLEVIREMNIAPEDDIMVLYPTYIGRTRCDIRAVWAFYEENKAVSVMCAYPCIDHPYLTVCPHNNWKRLVDTELYRRQDYPAMYTYSFFIYVTKASVVDRTDNQLICPETQYYLLDDKPKDIDTLRDIL